MRKLICALIAAFALTPFYPATPAYGQITKPHSMLPPIGPYPDSPCTLASRMEIYFVDGELWECICEALKDGHVCDWYNHGPVPATEARRIAWKLHLKRLPVRRPIPVPLNMRLAL